MSQPTFFTEGNEPRVNDTRLKIWKKILGALQDKAGANPENDPLPNDTLHQTMEKVNRAKSGV